MIVNARDVTERVRAQEKLLETEAKLRQAHKMEAVGRLAGGIAHDFNNVLTAIYGYADLLLEEFVAGDPRRSDVEEIRRMAERAATLTRQLLAFSRQQMLQPQMLDLNIVIEEVQRMLARMIGTDIQLFVRAFARICGRSGGPRPDRAGADEPRRQRARRHARRRLADDPDLEPRRSPRRGWPRLRWPGARATTW